MTSTDQQVSAWEFGSAALYFVALLPPPHPGFALGEYRFAEQVDVAAGVNPWNTGRRQSHPEHVLHLYRRRAVIMIGLNGKKFEHLDDAIRWSVSSEIREAALSTVVGSLAPTPERHIKLIPVLVTDFDVRSGTQESWIGSGATSFHFRMYDASIGRQALVRASRHIIVVAGAGGRIIQEVVNLLYEKLLYADEEEISNESVFAFLDGLARYTIPTENSIFLQREFARLGLLLAAVQVLVGVWGVFAGGSGVAVSVASLVLLVVLVVLTYLIVRRARLVGWK